MEFQDFPCVASGTAGLLSSLRGRKELQGAESVTVGGEPGCLHNPALRPLGLSASIHSHLQAQPGNTYFTISTLYLKILQWLSYFYDRIKSKLSPACEAFRSPSSAYWIPLSSAIPPSLSRGLTTRNLLSGWDPANPDVMTAFALAPPPNRSTQIAVATPHEWVFALIFFYNGSKILLHPCDMFYLKLPLYMPVSNSSL